MSIPIKADWSKLTQYDTDDKKIDYTSIKIAIEAKRKQFGGNIGKCFDLEFPNRRIGLVNNSNNKENS